MPLIYKPYQANIANKAGQKLYYPRLVKFSKMVNTQKMAELIAEKASLTPGDVHNVIRNLMSVMRERESCWRVKSAVRRSFRCAVSLLPNIPVLPMASLPAH